jgi:hypothetical protein
MANEVFVKRGTYTETQLTSGSAFIPRNGTGARSSSSSKSDTSSVFTLME